MNEVTIGGWLSCVYKAISHFDLDDPIFDAYDTVVTCGKTADLLSSIRALGLIDANRFETYRVLSRLKRDQALDVVKKLEGLGALDIKWKKDADPPAVAHVSSCVTNKADVLAMSAKLLQLLHPSQKALAAIETLDNTVHIPMPEARVKAALVQKGFSERVSDAVVRDLTQTGLLARTTETESGEPLLYNSHVFQKNATDAYKTLNALSAKDRTHALELLEHVRKRPGIPFDPSADKRIVTLLAKCGMIDLSGVQVRSGATTREFPTAPDIWGVFSSKEGALSKDLIDDSKLLLNSLRYGEIYSPAGRGRINDPAVLIAALIGRGQVGPATAIGDDYPLPLARGIVDITESRLKPGRFYMELRKNDVAEAVRDVLEQHTILPAGDIAPAVLQEAGGTFHSPESIRIKRPLSKELIEARDSLAFQLRTQRKRT